MAKHISGLNRNFPRPRLLLPLWAILAIWIAATACRPAAENGQTMSTLAASAEAVLQARPTLAAAADSATRPPAGPPSATPTIPQPTAGPTIAFSPAGSEQLAHYTLDARLDYDHHRLDVNQRLVYPNHSGRSLTELLLVVEADRYAGVFQLHNVTWPDGQPVEGAALAEGRLLLSLPRPLPPGQSVTVDLAYTLRLPAVPGPLSYTARQANLGDWYPFVPPHNQNGRWLAHEPAAAGEHLVFDLADFAVTLAVSSAGTAPVIAAPTEPLVAGQALSYRLPAARSFAWSASPEYERHDRPADPAAGEPAVTFFAFPEHRRAVAAVLDTTAQSAALYSSLFGPYLRPRLTVVEADFHDGMEYDGLYFLDWRLLEAYPGDPQGYLVPITAHETAHQWWYGQVANDQALEPWLDEALCTYSELLYYRAIYPELEIWWWWFRVNRFEPAGSFAATIYDFDAFRPYVDAVYLNGARYLDGLRLEMGDSQFLAFLAEFATRGRGRLVTATDFYELLATYNAQ